MNDDWNESDGPFEPVRLEIEYCEFGHLRGHAESIASAARSESSVVERLRPSRGGVFEVRVDGRLIYSKRATSRVPDVDEVLYHVRAAARSRERRACAVSA